MNVIEGLKSIGQYKETTESYLFNLVDSVPTVANVESFVTVLREKSIARDLYDTTVKINKKVLTGEEAIGDILAETELEVKNIANRQSLGNMENISVGMDKVFTKIVLF